MKPRFALLFCAIVLALSPMSARALQFSSSFHSYKIVVHPGETVSRTFMLQLAPKQSRVHFQALVEDWWQSEDGSQSFYREAGTVARSCGRWISLDPNEAAVEPGGTLTIRFTARVPASVGPGGYWCVLTVNELPDPLAEKPTGVGVRFLTSISTGIFLFLQPMVRQIDIGKIDLAPGQARLTFRNTGNSPVWIEGHIDLSHQGSEAVVATAPLPKTTLLTGPFARRFVTTDLPDLSTLPPGRYRMRVILDIGLDHLIGAERELVLPHDLTAPSKSR